jgi:membrane protease YdiL (CAAX protease family)
MVVARYLPMAAARQSSGFSLVTPLGAGIYEELVFRLIGFTVLNLILLDLLHFPKPLGILLIVLISAFLFSAYHYLGYEAFQWRTFVFRTAAGVYFGTIFLLRGFGVTAGSHAAYDLIVAALLAGHRG